MNKYRCAQYLRRRLALLLLISILNLVASPLLLATRAKNKEAFPLNPFDGPTEFIRRIDLTTNDLVYSASTGKLYASIPSSAGSSGNSIAAIDPTTGVVGTPVFVGSEPNKLALSDDGNSLYVSLAGSFAIRRFNTLTNTPGLQFSLGQDPLFGRYSVSELAVAPGNPDLLAVARVYATVSPPEGGVAVFDNGVPRTKTGPGHSVGSDFLAFSASASKLYGTGQSSGLTTMAIDASGVTISFQGTLATGARIKFTDGKIFSGLGHVINPDTNTLLGTFTGINNTRAFVPDVSAGRAYYLTNGPSGGTLSLKAFDINTFLSVGTLIISGVNGTPTSLVRWGANGLAFRTDSNQLFIVQTSLIPSAEPIPTPTPTPSPVPSPSPSPAAAFVRQIGLPTNDLVYSQATQKFYASVPGRVGSTGNSVAEIDPVMGSISNQTFVGSEPTQLALADDGQTLYVGLDGAASIRNYNIISHTAGDQFPVGRDSFTGPYSVSDIAVAPSNPSVVAVARQQRFSSPSEAGVAIFDGGVQRTKTGPGHIEGSDFLAFGSSSTLYGNSFEGVNIMTVDSTGVTVTGTQRLTVGNSLIFDNNLLYAASGQVLNPATGDVVGSFFGSATFGFVSGAIHAVDSANGRVFFLVSSSGSRQLRAFDINTFLPLGFVNISGVSGDAFSLVRWGTNGLAFRTNNGQVFLIETDLVNSSVPVASPTPTPSPTPSPSPPYIPTFVRPVNLPANSLVYSDATHGLYASVPSSAGAGGNSITKITPETGAIGPSTFIGSEPNKIAISDDGQTMWVHLDGANAARRFDVLTQTPGLQFNTSSQPPADMEVVPGSPQSVAISRSFANVAIYDNGVQRPNLSPSFPSVGPLEFGASPSILYGLNNTSSSLDLVKYLVDASGLTQSSVTGALLTGGTLEFSNGLLYSGFGRVADPEAKTLVGTFQNTGFASGMAVDAANHRVFFASAGTNTVVINGFDSNTFLPIGSVTLAGVSGAPINLVRWGTNGLAFNIALSSGPPRVYLVQTELVSNAEPIPVGFQFELDNQFTFEGASSVNVKVLRTGDISGAVSVNYATADGTATAGSDYTATSGTLNFAAGELSKTVSIPIINDNLFEGVNETFSLTLSNPSAPAIVTTPSINITLQDNDSKPQVSIAPTLSISEGDSGTKNAAVNVTLSNPSVETVTIDYATANGSATAGNDYVATSGTLTFAPGTTSATINVPINGDTTVESNETFSVTLSNAVNVSFVFGPTLTVTIVNDDATVQVSSGAINVNEAASFATVTITRVGDTSRVATVHYATNDVAGLQNCTIVNGKASERCDYATTVGLMQFAIGETAKTFIIPIVDDALVEGDETFTVNLSGATGATLGVPNPATITIIDNDTAPATQNPIDGVTPFITQQYIDFLGRLPDSIGLANWIDTLGHCPNNGLGEFDNPDCDRVHVSAGFFLSEEFRGRGYFAYKFYEVGFDRRPTYLEFVPDMATVGGAQSPESEVISKAAYTDAFAQRQEFKNRYDALSNADYVNTLEANAEVVLANKAALIDALNANQKTRAQVLREIVELQSVSDKFFIRAFVALQYFGYLRRDPDTIGYANWVTTLTADPNNFRHMIFGFIYSDEYRHRFGP